MKKFLVDANMSIETAAFLEETFHFDVTHVRAYYSLYPSGLSDEDIVAIAKCERRVVVTFDLDFGEIYCLRERGAFGAMVFRLRDQTVESVNRTLAAFFRGPTAADISLDTSLVVVEESGVRVVRPEDL